MTTSSEPAVRTEGGTYAEGLANGRDLLGEHPDVALQQAETLLRVNAAPSAFALAAEALRRLGRGTEAEQAELSGIKASFAVRELDKVAVLGRDGRHAEAQRELERFLQAEPDNLLALTMAAEVDITKWHLESAKTRLQRVLERAPSFLRAIILMIDCLRLQARLKEAIALAESVVARKSDNVVALRRLADLLAEGNRHEEAAGIYGRILDLDESDVEATLLHAHQLRMLGRADESRASFRRALAIDPNFGAAWWALAYYYPSSISSEDEQEIEQAAREGADNRRNAGALHIALGLLADRRGDREQAFGYISEGKKLRSSMQSDSTSAAAGAGLDGIIDSLTPERYSALEGAGYASDAPIFIIGMPRSGTTLLERILGRHSQIEATGELPVIARLFSAHSAGSMEHMASLDANELKKLGSDYIERSADYRFTDKPHFIDKMNSNWSRAGVIRMMLPNARIIDLRRDALDCCWSNFKMMFAEGISAGSDLRALGRLYRDYVRMVDAVDRAAPGGILKVSYEDLVNDVESETRRIFDFLGLEYEPDCINFHLSREAVATPSSEQIRQPINRKGIGSAEPYRQWLGPLIDELGELAR